MSTTNTTIDLDRQRADFEAVMRAAGYSEESFSGFYAEGEFTYYDSRANCMLDAWQAALAAREGQQEPVARTTHLQFLTDVVTAAGLLSHGRTDKALAKRISDRAYEIRATLYAAPVAQQSEAGAHHMTPENVAAIIADLREIESGSPAVPVIDRDWRTWAGVLARVIEHLVEAGAPTATGLTSDWRETVESLEEAYAADSSLGFMGRAAQIIRDMAAPTSGRESAAPGAKQDALAEEAAKLAPILRGMCEGGGEEREKDIYADDYQAGDGDVFVTRAADLLDEIAAMQKGAQDNG